MKKPKKILLNHDPSKSIGNLLDMPLHLKMIMIFRLYTYLQTAEAQN